MYELKIKKFRTQKKLTQKQLGELAQVSRNYISELENDKYYPTIDVLIRICVALEVDPNSIVGWETAS
ncbi:helix-turn-helix transcriptional regulator [uncultured Clostridium sp.]|jgi:transcriptional regulator with XRE-family HTH domain|uniref:helix-turn-helix transcriptional regulator n=1 Tax=uncultured Clostridium sp. TaxID=59620 RepID=UPI00261F3846|nr:helix-turn-helix transcriptional regulator [uncultured Clostridium sp.]